MALSTFTELQASIARTLNRTDLTSDIPDFIALLEAELDRHEATRFDRGVDITLTASPHVLPADVREMTSLYYDDGLRHRTIDLTSAERLTFYKAQLGETGFPRYAAVVQNGEALLLAPEPDTSYVVHLEYVTKLDKLGGTTTSNWILQDHPDIYLYGSLLHSAPFLKDDTRVQLWEGLKEKGIAQLDDLVRRRRWSGNTATRIPPRVIGP